MKGLGTGQDVQIVNDSAVAQIEEILAESSIPCASSLPVTNMCKSVLNRFLTAFAEIALPLSRCVCSLLDESQDFLLERSFALLVILGTHLFDFFDVLL